MFNRAWMWTLGLGLMALQLAQALASEPSAPEDLAAAASSEPTAPPPSLRSIDPYQAYAQGRFAEAFEGFANLQVKRPKDVDLMLNVGAALYRLKDFAGADKAWSLAAEHGDPNIRAQALYDMGNSAMMQQHLEQAIQHYQSALSLFSQDEDAQHNLQLAQKRLEAQKQKQDQDQKQPQDPNAPQDANQKSADPASQDPNASQSQSGKDGGGKPHENPPANAQDQTPHQPQDPNGDEAKPQSHDKSDAHDTRGPQAADPPSAKAPAEKADKSEASVAQAGEASQDPKAKRMPRSQAERMLDAMGESRPRHAPAKDGAKQQPADGVDW